MNIYETLLTSIKEHSGMDEDQIQEAGRHGADAGWDGWASEILFPSSMPSNLQGLWIFPWCASFSH